MAQPNERDELPDGVERVRAPNAGPYTLSGTHTYLIGPPAWVIDPGPDDPGHAERVLAAASERGGVAGIVLTHRHLDHAGAAAAIRLRTGASLAAGRQTTAGVPSPFQEPSADRLEVDRELADGDRLGPFDVIATPGHSADHVSFLAGDVLFCGDTVLGEGSVFIPPDGGSLSSYLSSLQRLAALPLRALCPGHGPVVWEPRAKLREYIDHRLDRERRLLEALAKGLRAREDLLDEAWSDAPKELRPAAALTLEAHLQKLAAEGRLPDGVDPPLPSAG
jgi:glyoxylase-like metal-dependent hydrolase (beta-lactamase superfamily II)